MNIGFFTKKENGALFGNLPTMHLQEISLERVTKDKDNHPDFIATVEGAELGAGWIKTTKENKVYVSLKVIIPGQAPVYLAIFETEQPGQYVAVYSEPKKAKASEPSDF